MTGYQSENQKSWRFFMVNMTMIIVLFLSAIFLGFIIRTNEIIKEQMMVTARSHFKNILITRRWNARHGGVYVEKKRGQISNPFLKNPDIITIDGKIYTKKNPALMTREISEYAKEEGDFVYHITSLNPLNPDNRPDSFEKKALEYFENNVKEFSTILTAEGKQLFRYMAPLMVEKSCLACHGKQGYKTGDVRGGISVTFDISKIQEEMKINRLLIGAASFITGIILIFIIFLLVSRQAKKLTTAYDTISKMAITDDLTQIYNRRYFHTSLVQEIDRSQRYTHPISLLMMDIDHFKQVNDSHGHQTGDKVLLDIARIITSATRENDIVARYGGEEIAVVLPETGLKGAKECAEKIRRQIRDKIFLAPGNSHFSITVSIGVSCLNQIHLKTEEAANTIIKMADQALYEAKTLGRNQVVSDNEKG